MWAQLVTSETETSLSEQGGDGAWPHRQTEDQLLLPLLLE